MCVLYSLCFLDALSLRRGRLIVELSLQSILGFHDNLILLCAPLLGRVELEEQAEELRPDSGRLLGARLSFSLLHFCALELVGTKQERHLSEESGER